VFDTKVQAVRDDLAGRFIDEYRQPFHDGKGDITQSHSGDNAIAFHAAIICPEKETFGLQFGKVTDHCRTVYALIVIIGFIDNNEDWFVFLLGGI
jgi:hypothetical protein